MKQIDLVEINDFHSQLKHRQFYANSIAEHFVKNHSRIERPHKHNFYATFLFTSGFGTHEIDYQSYEIKPGSVFFLYPGQVHSWELSEDCDGMLFFHSLDFFEKGNTGSSMKDFPFFQSNFTEKCFYLTNDQTMDIERILKNLYEESQNQLWKQQQMILSYVQQMYIKLNRFIENQSWINYNEARHYQKLFLEFELLVDTYFKEDKSATSYANRLHITQKHLSRVVKQMTNKTPTQVITERVILEAQRLMHFSKMNFQEIAHDLGYEDYAYFTRIFKKQTGETPTVFTQKYKEDGF